MSKPTLQEFGITESEYKSYREFPKRIGITFAVVGCFLGILVGFLFAYNNFGFPNILQHKLETFGYLWTCWIIGGVTGFLLSVFFRNSIISQHKLHLLASAYENALLSYRRTQEEYWKSLKGRDLEREISNLFSSQGYTTELTLSTNDKGIDIILRKGDFKTIVQCKGHSKPVGSAIVRDLYGTLTAPKADLAILVSISGFTKGACDFAKGKRIQLFSLNDVTQLSDQLFINTKQS